MLPRADNQIEINFDDPRKDGAFSPQVNSRSDEREFSRRPFWIMFCDQTLLKIGDSQNSEQNYISMV